jgi:hypothetical protein
MQKWQEIKKATTLICLQASLRECQRLRESQSVWGDLGQLENLLYTCSHQAGGVAQDSSCLQARSPKCKPLYLQNTNTNTNTNKLGLINAKHHHHLKKALIQISEGLFYP